jgi:hypothetical protein
MKFTIAIEPDTGWGNVTVSGDIQLDGLRELMTAAWNNAAYCNVDKTKFNLLNAKTALYLTDIMELTQWVSENKRGRGAKTIAIIASNDLMFGVSRMFHALQGEYGYTVNVFRTENEADAWLSRQA